MDVSTSKPSAYLTDWRSAAPFVMLGSAAVVVGGLVSAGTASGTTQESAWSAAYLTLVVGVAQVGFGLGQAWVSGRRVAGSLVAGQFVSYNLGNAGVLLGTLSEQAWMVDVGGVLLVIALSLFFWTSLSPHARHGRSLLGYRALLLLIGLSVPVGLLLAGR